VRYIKLAISSAFERTVIYRIVSYRYWSRTADLKLPHLYLYPTYHPACNRQTDGRTDTRRHNIPR